MKNTRLFLCLLLALSSGTLCLLSCTGKKQTDSAPAVVESKQTPVTGFRLALANLNIADQKEIFRGASPDIRSAIWQDRLQEAMSMSLTKEQKDVLQLLAPRLTPAVYNPDSTVQRKEFENFYIEWYPRALEVFKQDSAKFIAISTQLGNKNETAKVGKPVVLPDCDCNLAARLTRCDDCWFTNCKTVACKVSIIGCGCFWFSRCDGVCK
jgi:hypothetical protein